MAPEPAASAVATHRQARSRRAVTAAGLVGLGALLLVLDVPLCPMAAVAGIPCPGCGLTRASLALLSGDVSSALRFHPLVFVGLPLVSGFATVTLWSFVRGPSAPRQRLGQRAQVLANVGGLVLAVAFLAVWVARFQGSLGGAVDVDPPIWSGFRR